MKTQHQLAATMFLDIFGYTALMEESEARAIRALTVFSYELIERASRFNGSIIQFWGDGCLIVFQSAVEAVQYGIEVQRKFQQNGVPVRVGINSGEIILMAGNVYGKSVNISARIESIGVPGSVLISDSVQRDISRQTKLKSISLGVFQLKNVSQQVEIFALDYDGLVVPGRKELLKPRINWSQVAALLGLLLTVMAWTLRSLIKFSRIHDFV